MEKHKLLLPAVIAIIILLGTSLAYGIVNMGSGDEVKEDRAGVNRLHDFAGADIGQEQEPPILTEEVPNEEDLDNPDEELAAGMKDADDGGTDSKEVDKADKEEMAEEPQQGPTPQPVKNQMARVTVDGLNVRPDPSTNNQPIDVLRQRQTVEVLAEQDNWLQVELTDGRIGWISATYVSRFSPSSGGGGSLAGRVIAIDPGHGGSDPGAVGVTGLQEKELNLDVSLRVAAKLSALGAEVIMTRETDVFIPLAQRVAIAEAAGAQVFVSVHANAHPNPQIGGTETYYYRNKSTSSASSNLATLIQGELVGALHLRDIGVKHGDFLVIRQTSIPSVLLELGFLSNAHEESLMRTNEFREKAADAIVRGLQDYYN